MGVCPLGVGQFFPQNDRQNPFSRSIGAETRKKSETTMMSAPQQAPAGDAYAFVGERLRELRKQNGMTQADVARIIDVSPQQYQKYEDAQTKCSLTVLIALAEHYGIDLNALLPPGRNDSDQNMAANDDATPTTSEADLLARLVGAFVKLQDFDEKRRLVQLVEAIQVAHDKNIQTP